jgi:serine/threonine protein kinase
MLPKGTLIDDRYEVVTTLGVGGFGAVFRAVHKQFDRCVAIKTLNTTLLQEPDGLPRFEREARAINELRHRNIVGFHGYGVWRQAPYMVMELIEGTSIEKILQDDGKIEPARALRILRQMLEGLSCAHAAGVVHRDLKPSNIMLTGDPDGREIVKIIDFGLAKLMPGYGVPGQKLTETGYALGTARYMPPEQALGGVIDQRADIYSAGCIFYQMLTGSAPYEADDNITIMFKHLNEQPQPLSKFIQPPAPVAALQTFIDNCIAKDSENRYQQCSDAIRDIDFMLEGRHSKVAPLAAQQLKSVHKNPTKGALTAVTVAILCFAMLLGGGFAFVRHQKERAHSNLLDADRSLLDPLSRRTDIDPSIDLATLTAIKKRDDSEHYLTPKERFILLVYVATSYQNAKLSETEQILVNRCAKDCALEAYALYNKVPDIAWPIVMNLVAALVDTGARAQAIALCKQIEFNPRIDSIGHQVARRQMINYLIADREFDKARELILASLHERGGLKDNIPSGLTMVGDIAFLEGNLERARSYYNDARQASVLHGSLGFSRGQLQRSNSAERRSPTGSGNPKCAVNRHRRLSSCAEAKSRCSCGVRQNCRSTAALAGSQSGQCRL